MKKEKSEEKETLEVNKLITKKEKIKDNIVDIIDIDDEETEEFKFSGGKLVIDDSLNVIGKWESKNYTSLGDGVYMGFVNSGEHEITLMESKKKHSNIFDFGLENGYIAINRTTLKVIVKNKKGYIDCRHLTLICDYLKKSINSKEKEIKSLENSISRIESHQATFSSEESRGTVLKSQKEILCELNEKLPSQKKLYEELSMKRTKLLQEVQEEYENCLKSSSEMEKVMEERKKSYDAELVKCYGKEHPTSEDKKNKHKSEELALLEKLLKEGRKTIALINYRIPNYEDMLEILSGKSIKRKSKRKDDDD